MCVCATSGRRDPFQLKENSHVLSTLVLCLINLAPSLESAFEKRLPWESLKNVVSSVVCMP